MKKNYFLIFALTILFGGSVIARDSTRGAVGDQADPGPESSNAVASGSSGPFLVSDSNYRTLTSGASDDQGRTLSTTGFTSIDDIPLLNPGTLENALATNIYVCVGGANFSWWLNYLSPNGQTTKIATRSVPSQKSQKSHCQNHIISPGYYASENDTGWNFTCQTTGGSGGCSAHLSGYWVDEG